MPENVSKIKINLEPNPKNKLSTIFFNWMINIGKVIIVLTELIALGALFYRFYIDRQIIDLNDQIRINKKFIEAQSENESRFRNLQDRLTNIDTLSKPTIFRTKMFNFIRTTPEANKFNINSISLSKDTIVIDGVAASLFDLNKYMEDLKKSKNISTLSLDSFSNTQRGVEFKLTAGISE